VTDQNGWLCIYPSIRFLSAQRQLPCDERSFLVQAMGKTGFLPVRVAPPVLQFKVSFICEKNPPPKINSTKNTMQTFEVFVQTFAFIYLLQKQ
jgi:hypothetical protein